ncbi:putative Oxidoreductase [Seiridium cardinale]
MVTGGNSALGYELCKILFQSGATVYMVTRSKERVETAFKSIRGSNPDTSGTGQLKFIHLDLADIASVRTAARQFAQEESKLDALWNNGGIGANAVQYGERTKQDLEILMGIHCVGALLFTELLIPELKAASVQGTPSRVAWLTTILVDTSAPKNGVEFPGVDTGYEARMENYAASKAGVWILCREFAKRHKEDGIISVALNPGSLETGSFRGTPRITMFLMRLAILHKPIYGAYTMLYAGLSPEVTIETSGIFIYPWGRLVQDSDVVRQDILQAAKGKEEGGLGLGPKLWAWCESKWNIQSEDQHSGNICIHT